MKTRMVDIRIYRTLELKAKVNVPAVMTNDEIEERLSSHLNWLVFEKESETDLVLRVINYDNPDDVCSYDLEELLDMGSINWLTGHD